MIVHYSCSSCSFFPNFLPSSTALSIPSLLSTSRIQLFLWHTVLIRQWFHSSLSTPFSLHILYFQSIRSNLLHNHISSGCTLLISALRNVHVSHPYNTTGHISTFTTLFCNVLYNLILLLKSLFSC